RAQLRIPDGALAVGYAGGLREIKGPDRLLEAFLDKFADRGDMHLFLIGTGPMESSLRAAARGHANVHFTGLIPNAARLLPALDVYAQTSLSEGRSLSMLEAMAAGLPTLAHDLVPVREIHGHEQTALLVAPGDRAALGSALQRLVADAGPRGRSIRQRVAIGPALRARHRPRRAGARRPPSSRARLQGAVRRAGRRSARACAGGGDVPRRHADHRRRPLVRVGRAHPREL